LLAYVSALGLKPGAQVTVIEIAPLNGPLTCRVGSRSISLSREVAGFIWVSRAE
jgi:Fe2+ transport system protein FeoA